MLMWILKRYMESVINLSKNEISQPNTKVSFYLRVGGYRPLVNSVLSIYAGGDPR